METLIVGDKIRFIPAQGIPIDGIIISIMDTEIIIEAENGEIRKIRKSK